MLGETYDRLLAGDAIMDPGNPLHLPDDRQWHGIGNESHYKMDSYFDTNHTFNLCAAWHQGRLSLPALMLHRFILAHGWQACQATN